MEEIDRQEGRFREEKGFLVVENAQDLSDTFDVKMLLNNEISGILPLQLQYIDNQCIYRYLTGEKISLATFLLHDKLRFKAAYQLWNDIFYCCGACGEYLLQTEHLLLCPEYIYRDPQTQGFSFCYFPGAAEALEVQIKMLCEFLLPVTDHQEKLGREFVYGWYDQLMGRGFSMSELEHYLKSYRNRENNTDDQFEGESEKRQECLKQEVHHREEQRDKTGESNYYLKNVSKYPEALEQLPLSEGTLSVGRAPGCDVVLPVGQISWHHARIEIEEDKVFVTDTSSSNGVFLNKKRLIKEHPVLCKTGDIIGFADITYLLCTG